MDRKIPSPPLKRGPKPKVVGAPATSPVTIKLTPPQREKLQRLGGAPWVRERIDKAKEPNA